MQILHLLHLTKNDQDKARRFCIALLLIIASWATIAIAEFHVSDTSSASTLFQTPTDNLAGWLAATCAQSMQSAQASIAAISSIAPFDLILVLLFVAPAIAVLAARKTLLQTLILLALALCFTCDLGILLTFDGYSSANGSYDSAGFLAATGLHGVCGFISIVLGLSTALRAQDRS